MTLGSPRLLRAAAGISTCVLCLAPLCLHGQEKPAGDRVHDGYADPNTHPYADPSRGREPYRYRYATKNEFRLYDFYDRQARHYLAGEALPDVVPAFPGIDAGLFGHWGKYSEMGRIDGRWERIQIGPAFSSIIQHKEHLIPKALTLRLKGETECNLLFDMEHNLVRAVWNGGFLDFPQARWGILGTPSIRGELLLDNLAFQPTNSSSQFNGYFIDDDRIVISYAIDGTPILDLPLWNETAPVPRLSRIFEFPVGATDLRIPIVAAETERLARLNDTFARILIPHTRESIQVTLDTDSEQTLTTLSQQDGGLYLVVRTAEPNSCLSIEVSRSLESLIPLKVDYSANRPSRHIHGGKDPWHGRLIAPNILRSDPNAPFVVDSIGVPMGNPYLSPMFLTGLDFFDNGDAAICTFFGDVWLVTEFLQSNPRSSWKRIASGLHHPMGLEIVDGVIHVVGRDQITALRDPNADGHIDHYENAFNDFETHLGSHDFNSGLQQDAAGNLYFASANNGIMSVSLSTKDSTVLARSIRNPNGIGVSPQGAVLTSAQEGEWTPATMIVKASNGGSYGWYFGQRNNQPSPPLAYVPRGIDHSSGGQVFVPESVWGAMAGSFLGLSYGNCVFYHILESEDGHGAIVPLEGEFLAGAHRARFNPADGHLYVIGTQGWGTYAQYEGSFERVRKQKDRLDKPTSFRVYTNGIQLDFSESPLQPIQDRSAQFCQQWNYRYSSGYGSPEYSVKHDGAIGHDVVRVNDVIVFNDGKSAFFELAYLEAAMQTHLYFNLAGRDSRDVHGSVFLTALDIDKAFDPTQRSATRSSSAKRMDLSRQVVEPTLNHESVPAAGEGRIVSLQAIPGPRFDRNSISAIAGERITLRLKNNDTMPHNWILGQSGSYLRIGELADAFASDPKFAALGYIPESENVLVAIPVVDPGASREATFNAPATPGTYPFVCAFPGHWRAMKGTLIVY